MCSLSEDECCIADEILAYILNVVRQLVACGTVELQGECRAAINVAQISNTQILNFRLLNCKATQCPSEADEST